MIADGPTPFSGPGPIVASDENFAACTYTLSEQGPGGYSASAWVCEGGPHTLENGNTITMGPGVSVTCTITNDDLGPGEVTFEDGFESG